MKIALIALPNSDEPALPLPLAYAAALLEQGRHIVRIYDLAVRGSSGGDSLASLRTFRPHIALIASADHAAALETEQRAAEIGASVLHLGLEMREWTSGQSIARALRPAERGPSPTKDEQNVIIDALLALDDDLDTLPFPARHLLSLEQYRTYTAKGSLQTALLVGHPSASGYQLRTPALIVAETRTVAHEHAVLHVQLHGAPLTHDTAWLNDLLSRLAEARIGLSWEGCVAYQRLTPEILEHARGAGCELLEFAFDAMEMLDSASERARLSEVVRQAHDLDIAVRARISLDPRFSAVPALVDMAATFGLEDARFVVEPYPGARAHGQTGAQQPGIADLVRARYQSSRSRQLFVNRYGARLGPLVWRLSRAGLFGQGLRAQALGLPLGEVAAEG